VAPTKIGSARKEISHAIWWPHWKGDAATDALCAAWLTVSAAYMQSLLNIRASTSVVPWDAPPHSATPSGHSHNLDQSVQQMYNRLLHLKVTSAAF
jgi:hypothetical protein